MFAVIRYMLVQRIRQRDRKLQTRIIGLSGHAQKVWDEVARGQAQLVPTYEILLHSDIYIYRYLLYIYYLDIITA